MELEHQETRLYEYISSRDTDDVLNTSHLSSADYTTSTDESEIFSSMIRFQVLDLQPRESPPA
jgi:hypothetical protein